MLQPAAAGSLLGSEMGRVLVTGGAGFIGSHLCEALANRGHSVVVVDNLSSGHAANLSPVANRVEFIQADVRDVDMYRYALEGVTTVYHLAALISSQDSLREADDYMQQNALGTLRVLEALPERRGVRVMFASSSTVYGVRPEARVMEQHVPAPVTPYALSKLASEHLLRMYGSVMGFSSVCLRLFNVYGPRQSPDHAYANVTCKFAKAAATDGRVLLYGDGEQTRDFIFVSDVVRAFVAAGETATASHVYNVGSGEQTSIRGLVNLLGTMRDGGLRVDQRAPWPNDIRAIEADCDLAKAEWGFRAEVSLKDGLRQTVEYFRALG